MKLAEEDFEMILRGVNKIIESRLHDIETTVPRRLSNIEQGVFNHIHEINERLARLEERIEGLRARVNWLYALLVPILVGIALAIIRG